MTIPKKIHIVWVGDESKIPLNMIHSWREKNPSWRVIVWGNEQLLTHRWINKTHIDALAFNKIYCGVADIMRYEILFSHGGFAVDADSICIKSLEDWLFDSQICASMENEIIRPGLIANGYLASEPNSVLMAELIMRLNEKESVLDEPPWIATGPRFFTETIHALKYSNITLWPSHYFLPEHFTGQRYLGAGHCFAKQIWGTTRGISDNLTSIVI